MEVLVIDIMVRNFFSISAGWFLVFLSLGIFADDMKLSQALAGFVLFFAIGLFIPLIFYLFFMHFLEKFGISSFFTHSLMYPITLMPITPKIYDEPTPVAVGFAIYIVPYFAIRLIKKVYLS